MDTAQANIPSRSARAKAMALGIVVALLLWGSAALFDRLFQPGRIQWIEGGWIVCAPPSIADGVGASAFLMTLTMLVCGVLYTFSGRFGFLKALSIALSALIAFSLVLTFPADAAGADWPDLLVNVLDTLAYGAALILACWIPTVVLPRLAKRFDPGWGQDR